MIKESRLHRVLLALCAGMLLASCQLDHCSRGSDDEENLIAYQNDIAEYSSNGNIVRFDKGSVIKYRIFQKSLILTSVFSDQQQLELDRLIDDRFDNINSVMHSLDVQIQRTEGSDYHIPIVIQDDPQNNRYTGISHIEYLSMYWAGEEVCAVPSMDIEINMSKIYRDDKGVFKVMRSSLAHTITHEIIHTLGIWGHSKGLTDVMCDGNECVLPDIDGPYLSERDRRSLKHVYSRKPTVFMAF